MHALAQALLWQQPGGSSTHRAKQGALRQQEGSMHHCSQKHMPLTRPMQLLIRAKQECQAARLDTTCQPAICKLAVSVCTQQPEDS